MLPVYSLLLQVAAEQHCWQMVLQLDYLPLKYADSGSVRSCWSDPGQIRRHQYSNSSGYTIGCSSCFTGTPTAMSANAAGTADKQLESTQSGWGVTPTKYQL